MKRIVCVAVVYLLPCSAWAEVTLNVMPHICVKTQKDSPCEFTSEVTVEQDSPVNVCVQADSLDYEQCFEPETTVQYKVSLLPSESFNLQVIDAKQKALLVEQWIRVLSHDPDATRVRRRFGWGF